MPLTRDAMDMLFVRCEAYGYGYAGGYAGCVVAGAVTAAHLLPSQYHLPSAETCVPGGSALTPGAYQSATRSNTTTGIVRSVRCW